ncbi:MAG: associated Golgi protein-like protein [Frankiales bacterium]|nr:associated Golgi protein-like protein [Frankiales bacterium]
MDPLALLPEFLSAETMLAFGLVGLMMIVFAETGLLVGFFLPGDSLLFLAGVFAASGQEGLSLWMVLIGVPVAAFLGAQTGWWIGKKAGPSLFERPDARLFAPSHVVRAQGYLDTFGEGRAIVIARFLPIARTFLNPICGVLGVPARRFAFFNAIGAVLWGAGLPLVGYGVARVASDAGNISIEAYLLPFAAVVVALSLIPVTREIRKARREAREGGLLAEHAASLVREDSPVDGLRSTPQRPSPEELRRPDQLSPRSSSE